MQAAFDDRRQRNEKDAGSFIAIDREIAGFDDGDERRDVEVVGDALAQQRQPRDDRHAIAFDADLFAQFAQGGRFQIGILGMRSPAGEADLSGMVAQVCGALDEDDAVRRRAKDRDDDGGLAARAFTHDTEAGRVPATTEGWGVSELAERECVPCRGGVPPLTREDLAPLLERLGRGWCVRERSGNGSTVLSLERTYRYKNFTDAMSAAAAIGRTADEQRHHPDLHVAWGALCVEIWTHKIGGLTESDFIFAAKCDAIVESLGTPIPSGA